MNYDFSLDDAPPQKLWFIAKTKRPEVGGNGIRKSEEIAVAHLAAQGHEVYLPYCRREGAKHSEIMFPGYVFIAQQSGEGLPWYSIRATRGVAYLLGIDGPQGYPEALVEELRKRERGGVVVIERPRSPYADLEPGQPMEVSDGGPFDGRAGALDAILEAPDGSVRLALWLDILGGLCRIEFPAESIKACAAT